MSPVRRFWPPVAWMAAIFLFSTSYFGSAQTGSVLDAVVRFFYPSASEGFLETSHFIIRKSAHFTEYAVLAWLWLRALSYGREGRSGRDAAFALGICALYAATDEFHQSFVPGRYESPYDVLIDSFGAAFALAVAWAKKMRTRKCAP